MANVLRNRLDELASQFAASVLSAIRGASLEELLAETSSGAHLALALPTARGLARALPGVLPRGRGARAAGARGPSGRLARRSPDQIAGVVEKIVALLKQNPRGLRAEQIRARLGLLAKEMPRPLKDALAAGRIGKSGQKRSTLYFVKGGGTAAAKGPGPKKAVPRAARKARKPRKASTARPKAKARRGKQRGSATPARTRRKATRPRAKARRTKAPRRAAKAKAKAKPAASPPPPPPAPAAPAAAS